MPPSEPARPGAKLLPVFALAIAGTVQPKAVVELLEPGAERVRVGKTQAIVRFAEERWFAVHDFGAFVFVGFPEDEAKRIFGTLSTTYAAEPRGPLTERFAIEIREGAAPSVAFDRVVVGTLEGRVVGLTSYVVGQSVGMEYHEDSVDSLVGELQRFAEALAARGKLRASDGELMRFVGRGMATRTQVVHTLALLDAPSVIWEDEALDRLYRELRAMFEIQDRYLGLDHKLRVIQDNLELLVDMTRQRRSTFLEVTVIALIAVELALALVRH
jgi:uncharacterized Rmd1/YagE family protein